MAQRRKVWPAREGLRVGDPAQQDFLPLEGPLAAAGREVVWSTYWQRQLDDGDVAVDAPPDWVQALAP